MWEDRDGCSFLEKLRLLRGKGIQNEQIMLKPLEGSSFGDQDSCTILKSLLTVVIQLEKGIKK